MTSYFPTFKVQYSLAWNLHFTTDSRSSLKMQFSRQNVSELQNSSSYKYCPNALASRLIITSGQSYAVAGAIAFLILPTFLANGLLLFVQTRTKTKSACKMHTVITTVNGCLFSVTALPMYTVLFTQYHQERNCFLENLSIFAAQTEMHILAYTILVLAIERYFCVRPNFGWSKSASHWMQSKTGSAITASFIFILSFLHGAVSVDFFGGYKSTVAKVGLVVINGVIALVVYAAYIKLYCEIRVHKISFSKIDRKQEHSSRDNASCDNRAGYMRKFIKTVSILLIAGIVCYLPFLVMDFWTGWYTFGLKSESPQNVRFFYYLSVAPMFFYSIVNASLFLYRNDQVRAFIRSTLKPKNRIRGTITSTEYH